MCTKDQTQNNLHYLISQLDNCTDKSTKVLVGILRSVGNTFKYGDIYALDKAIKAYKNPTLSETETTNE